jgi:hypothetical protein
MLKKKLKNKKCKNIFQIRDIFWKWGMHKKGQICLVKNYYMPILMYGAETWAWTKADSNILTGAERKFSNIEGKSKRKNKKPKIIENLKMISLEGQLTNNRIRL